jgi:hypothetical protein
MRPLVCVYGFVVVVKASSKLLTFELFEARVSVNFFWRKRQVRTGFGFP